MALWRPRIKPGPAQQIRLNPQGRLSRGLWSCILFENPTQRPAIKDYADPTRRLYADGFGEVPVSTISPWGGTALSFSTDTNSGFLGLETTTPATPSSTSCSFLTKFDGTNGGGRSFEVAPYYDPIVGANIILVSQSNNMFTDNDANQFLTPAVTSFSTWTRLTITFNGTTASLYANGAFQSSATLTIGFAPTRICGNWPWPMADFFFWFNRVLTPGEITAHYADPYGTTLVPLRPRFSSVGKSNQAVAPTTGAVTVTGFAPTAGLVVTPGGGEFLSEFTNEFPISVPGAVVITGRTPSVAQTGGPPTGTINITGLAPRVDRAANPAAAAMVITGFVPVPTLGTTGRITITGFAPTPNAPVPTATVVPGTAPVTVTPTVVTGDPTDFVSRLRAVLPFGWFPDTTPILDSVLSGCAVAWAKCYDLLSYVRTQTRIATATGVFLDLMAVDYFNGRLRRFINEPDSKFSTRIRANLLPERGTRKGVIDAVTALVGEPPIIFEPADTGDTGAWGGGNALVWRGLAYGQAGGWGSLALPFQAFVFTMRPRNSGIANVSGYANASGYGGGGGGYGVGAIEWTTPDMIPGQVPDDAIFQTISEAAPAGSIMWTRLGGATTGVWDQFTWDSGTVWQ